MENYTFEERNGAVTVTVDLLNIPEEFVGYMNDSYPKALEKLKEICEN